MNTTTATSDLIDEEARRRFENAWIRGCPEALEQFLPREAATENLATLEELVIIEMEFAWKAWSQAGSTCGSNQPTRVAEYRKRFPVLDSPVIVQRLLGEEFSVRQRYGDNPSSNEYDAEFAALAQTNSGTAIARESVVSTRDDLPRVPGYEVYGLLGRGGMGLVLKARQLSLGRIVALKMILLGSAARLEDIARLRTEAEAVARLQHPNVLQIYEVAEHNGWPYLTLEYVNGGNLAGWSAGEPQPARLAARLVATLAHAIHHAHQRGILHRDLKPANILLHRTDDKTTNSDLLALAGSIVVPKIADFGLAKVLGESQTQQTQTGAVIGTPCYMAPEQTGGRQQDIGIPTDVYALGAILYELLTGTPPFRASTALETLELVRSQEPAQPRKTQPKVPLDLETICLTCLAKDPSKRYASALALADDLNRFLAGESIAARPATRPEQVLKWVRRRPAWAALIAVSLVAAATLVIVVFADNVRLQRQRDIADAHQQKAEEQRQLAVAHLREARSAVDRLLTRVGFERLANAPYMETVRLELLKDALQFYEGFAQKESDDPEVAFEMGRAWRRLGKIHQELGDRAEAGKSFRSARGILKQLQGQAPNDESVLIELAACENNFADYLLQINGDKTESHQAILDAVELQERLRNEHPASAEIVQNLAESYDVLARSFHQSGQLKQAEDAFRRGVTTLESVASHAPTPRGPDMSLAERKRNLGAFLALNGRLKDAEPLFRGDVEFWQKLAEQSPNVPRYQGRAGDAEYNLCTLLLNSGRSKEGEVFLRRAMVRWQRLVDEYPKVPGNHRDLGKTQKKLAQFARDRHDFQAASPLLEQAIVHTEAGQKASAPYPNQRIELAYLYWMLADTKLQLGSYQSAAESAEKLPQICPDRWDECYWAACLLVRCATTNKPGEQRLVSEHPDNVERFCHRAVELLGEAYRRGGTQLVKQLSDPALKELRNRDDFKRLLIEVGGKQ